MLQLCCSWEMKTAEMFLEKAVDYGFLISLCLIPNEHPCTVYS